MVKGRTQSREGASLSSHDTKNPTGGVIMGHVIEPPNPVDAYSFSKSFGVHLLPDYGPVCSVKRPVRTRMRGVVGAGGEIPPATRFANSVFISGKGLRYINELYFHGKGLRALLGHISLRFRRLVGILPSPFTKCQQISGASNLQALSLRRIQIAVLAVHVPCTPGCEWTKIIHI